jgi:DNA-binding NarL/FixJ family response regulator
VCGAVSTGGSHTDDMRRSRSPIRTLLADEHALVRLAIRGRLERAGFDICAEAGDADGAVAAAVRERPRLCLLELGLEGDGIAAIRAIRSRVPESSIVILADEGQESLFLEAMQAGASGFLMKRMDPTRIPHALQDVVDGKAAVPRALVGRLLDELAS